MKGRRKHAKRGSCGVMAQRKPPKKPRPMFSPQASLTSPSILIRLFPPHTGTRPCRHRGAQHTLGTGAQCGKTQSVTPSCSAGCGNGLPASPPGCPWLWAAAGGGEDKPAASVRCRPVALPGTGSRVGGGAARSGPPSHKFGNLLRAHLSEGDRGGKYKNTPPSIL